MWHEACIHIDDWPMNTKESEMKMKELNYRQLMLVRANSSYPERREAAAKRMNEMELGIDLAYLELSDEIFNLDHLN